MPLPSPANYRITAKAAATAGDATFTIPYTSTSGATLDATVTVKVSNIAYTAPTNLTMAAGETLAISAGGYASDGTFTITCADATNISTEFSSVSTHSEHLQLQRGRQSHRNSRHSHLHRALHQLTGGDTHNGVISIRFVNESTDEEPEEIVDEPETAAPPPQPGIESSLPETAPPNGSLRWSFYTVHQGETSSVDIITQLAAPAHPYVWTWDTATQAWQRLPTDTSSLPAGTLVVFRTTQEPDPDTLAALNLGTTTQVTTLRQGWNVLSMPADLARLETESMLIDDLLLNCDARTQTEIIANYHTINNEWYIWLPCHPDAHDHYTGGSDPTYRQISHIGRTQPIYLCLKSPNPIAIAWNPRSQRYEIQNPSQPSTVDNPEPNPTTHTCSR